MKEYTQIFIAGITIPYLFFAIVASLLAWTNNIWVLQIAPLYLFGILWGLWNVLYYIAVRPFIDHVSNIRLVFGLHGAVLGIFLLLMLTLVFQVPAQLHLPSWILYPLVIIVPIIYFFVWYYLVVWLNNLFGFDV